jgi:hypothetical protein
VAFQILCIEDLSRIHISSDFQSFTKECYHICYRFTKDSNYIAFMEDQPRIEVLPNLFNDLLNFQILHFFMSLSRIQILPHV